MIPVRVDATERVSQTMPTNSSPNFPHLTASCSNCGLRELCLPLGLSADKLKRIDQIVCARRKVGRGEGLYRAGDAFSAIYAVCSGSFKNKLVLHDGREQVMGFHISGDILGIDGIGEERHGCDAVALEDSDVCVIPFARVEEISREMRGLQHQFHQLMSREIVRDYGVMLLLNATAEVRVAVFLLDLCRRFAARGYSASEFHLRMTREEIGSFLGLTLETVSRHLSRFHETKLIAVLQKHIHILDAPGLKVIAGAMN